MGYVIGIDVGGTFTDLLLMDSSTGKQTINKTSTIVEDPSVGVMNGLKGFAEMLDKTVNELLAETSLIVHGTTVTTNAVLTNNGSKTALVTTEGFRDVLQMRRGVRSRDNLFNNKYEAPPALVSRDLRIGVSERMDKNGGVMTAVDESQVVAIAEKLKSEKVEAVAISFMHSYANDEHEQTVKKIIEAHLPDAFTTVSTEVVPIIRLYDRTSTAVMNAYAGPILNQYITNLVEKLKSHDFDGNLLIMQSNGGVNNADTVKKLPATTLLSGPAAGPVAGGKFAESSGYDNAIVVDMGGTSFEASIVRDGKVSIRKTGDINKNSISLPMADIHTIGSGGGSIARVNDGGLLKVGPESAGATPGPVSYGRGGVEPTTSDANLVLGYLNDGYFLGGSMQLDKEAARDAIEKKIAEPTGITTEKAAFGIYSISNLNMSSGIKDVTVENGYDPREFPLVVAGGAGPVHAAMIARELGIKEIIVPRFSSVLCAVGMLSSMLRHDYLRSHYSKWSEVDHKALYNVIEDDVKEGRTLLSAEGVAEDEQIVIVGLDLRYLGQHFEVTVEFDISLLLNAQREDVEDLFHEEHQRLYGFNLKGNEMELMNIRVSCQGEHTKFSIQEIHDADKEASGYLKNTREMYDPVRHEVVEANVYDGEEMGAGCTVDGPAIIELVTTTIVVPDQFQVKTERNGNFLMTDKGE